MVGWFFSAMAMQRERSRVSPGFISSAALATRGNRTTRIRQQRKRHDDGIEFIKGIKESMYPLPFIISGETTCKHSQHMNAYYPFLLIILTDA
jgi:hypothetical protein